MTEPTLEDVLASRVATYRLLARLFRVEVDQECYDELLGMRFPASTGSAMRATAPSAATWPRRTRHL